MIGPLIVNAMYSSRLMEIADLFVSCKAQQGAQGMNSDPLALEGVA